LGKDEASRLSDWAEDLTDSQRLYAALDVYATRLAYQTIMSKLSPVDLVKPRRMKDLEVGTKVVVVARGRADSIAGGDIREVSGEGNWCVLASSEAGTRASTITKRGRVVVRVREVYEPGAPLPYADMHGEKGKTLESALQQPDYDMLVDWQCLRMLQYPPLQPPPPLTTAAAPARDLEARMRLEARDREIIEQDERVVAALRAAAPHDLPQPPPGLPLNPLMGTPQALPPWALPGPPGIGLLPPVAWQNNQASMDRQAWHLFVIYID
jgi:hypothetical protein